MENMRVNHLPSLTWNALHMNDSRVDSAVTAGEAYIEKNLSMGLEEGIRGEELPCFEKIKTGMGPDMDALRKEGSMEPVQVTVPAGVKEQVLRLHIQRKPGESAFLPVEIAAEEDSEITVFVDDTGVKEEAGGTLALQFRADVKKGAKVRLVQVQLLSSQEQKLNDVGVSCADEGRFEDVYKRQEEYYVNMMIAWFFATALAKHYEAALPYIENHNLAVWTHNKTIQKAVESYRITPEQKTYLKTLKIKASKGKKN